MKKILLLGAFLLSFSINAQNNPVTTQSQFSWSFFLPGLEYESAVSNKTTISLRLGTGFSYASGMHRETEYGVYLGVRGQYRYFYNLQKRLNKEKKISNNSGNYFGLHADFSSGNPVIGEMEAGADFSGGIGPVWGIQRVYNSGFKLNLFLGAGYGFDDLGDSGISPIIGISLGWLIFG